MQFGSQVGHAHQETGDKKGDGGWVDVSSHLELLSRRKSQVASPAHSLVCSRRRNPGFHGPQLR